MGKADRLSWRLDWQERVANDNEDQTLIKLGQVKRIKTLVKENDLKKRIHFQKVQEEDKKVVKTVEKLKKARMKMLRDKEQTIKEVVIKER